MGTYPPINVFQQGDDLVAIVELPGVNKVDLNIQAKENTIRIAGQKTIDYPENVSLHRRERLSGVFDRTLAVPMQIHPDRIQAEYSPDRIQAEYSVGSRVHRHGYASQSPCC